MPDLSIRSPKLVTRQGAILLHRLGPLEFGEQSRWDQAPHRKGMWAFPYPLYDTYFTYHKYLDRLPKTLKTYHRSWIPKDPKWVYSNDPDSNVVITADLLKAIAEGTENTPDWFCVREEFHEERERWVKDIGRKIVPIRKFWYSGDFYTHLRPDGVSGGPEAWFKTDVESFVRRFKKNGGVVANFQQYLMRSSVDHLEIFIPKNSGRISG